MKNKKVTASIFLAIALTLSFIAGQSFSMMHEEEPIVKGPGVTDVKMLSEYFPKLAGTSGDTEIYILEGEKEGGSILIMGGTHPNEPSSLMSAVLLIEQAIPQEGTLYVIPRSNNSAFTHNDAQEGSPQRFTFETPYGERWFRYGSRATNPIDQWPDPDVYIHASSGQQLSGSETRNLNRGFPGEKNGTLTEQICYGIAEFIRAEKIDITVDLHEASPEYPVINAMVAHERAMGLASQVTINLQLQGIEMGLEPSPTNLRGLTHRELGDYTDTLAILMETANPAQGRLRGRTDEALVLTGIDPTYVKAAKLGRLFVPYDDNGHPLEQRVGRHLASIENLINSYSNIDGNMPITIENIPQYGDLLEKGIGFFLNPLN